MVALICRSTFEALFANIMFPDKTYLWSSLVRIHSVFFPDIWYMYIYLPTIPLQNVSGVLFNYKLGLA